MGLNIPATNGRKGLPTGNLTTHPKDPLKLCEKYWLPVQMVLLAHT